MWSRIDPVFSTQKGLKKLILVEELNLAGILGNAVNSLLRSQSEIC